MNGVLDRIESHWRPHAGQAAFLANQSRTKVLACGRRWGKTEACAVQVIAQFCGLEPSKQLILAPTQDQARILFDRVIEMADWLGPPMHRKVTRTPYPKLVEIREVDGVEITHTVTARSGHLGYALRGDQATHIIVDEAAYVPEALVLEVALPMLATTDGCLILISTPRGLNHFWRFFKLGQDHQHGVWSLQAPSRQNPRVSLEFLERQRELVSERSFLTEYEAEFIEQTGKVFRTDAVEACIVPGFMGELEGPFYIGIDWARYSDFTAVAVLEGHRDEARLVELIKFNGLSWSEQITRVAGILERFQPAKVLCDATGVGDPVLEMLRAKAPHTAAEGLVFTGPIKAEMIDQLNWMIEQTALRFKAHPDLMREFEFFEARAKPSGALSLGAANGYHDDLVVALALAARLLPRSYSGQKIRGRGVREFSRKVA